MATFEVQVHELVSVPVSPDALHDQAGFPDPPGAWNKGAGPFVLEDFSKLVQFSFPAEEFIPVYPWACGDFHYSLLKEVLKIRKNIKHNKNITQQVYFVNIIDVFFVGINFFVRMAFVTFKNNM